MLCFTSTPTKYEENANGPILRVVNKFETLDRNININIRRKIIKNSIDHFHSLRFYI